MKPTEQMIDAACAVSKGTPREDVSNIVQAALDAQEPTPNKTIGRSIAGAAVFSAMVTAIMLISSLFASGTWLDPRVWSGSYVPGDSMASRMENGAWVIDAAVSNAPWAFLGLWACLVACLLMARKFKRA